MLLPFKSKVLCEGTYLIKSSESSFCCMIDLYPRDRQASFSYSYKKPKDNTLKLKI
jgi:hypothetical protein